ncbi:MAG: threonine/serine exporter family protein, partial [Clostridia bacterium]|nr:threonine/serine exporter family protein [Clostridia bacterium]
MFNTILQIVMAALGTLSFCLILNVNKKHIFIPTIGGGLCWAMFLLLRYIGLSVFPATLFASAIIGIYGEICSHIGKYPP